MALTGSGGTIVAHRVTSAHLVASSDGGSLGWSIGASTDGLHHAGVGWQELTDVGGGRRTGQRGSWQQARDSTGVVDPLVHHDVVNSGTLGWVIVKYLRDEVSGTVSDSDVLREVICVHSDSLVGCLDVRCLEGGLTDNQSVDYDSDRPDVDLVRVTLLALEHFWGDIVRSTADGTLALSIELELGGETKITDLNLHLVVKEEITEFEISMDDAMTMQVLDGSANLVDIALDFKLVQTLTSSQKLIKGLVLAEFKEDVDVLSILKEVLEAYDVVLMKGSVNFDLRHQLLLGTSLSQGGLHNNLGSRNSLVLEVSELEAASETSLSEELALQVLLDADFAVVLDDFLLDDSLGTINAFFRMTLLHFVVSSSII